MNSDERRAAPPLLGAEWRDFVRWPLYAALAFSLLAAVLAYQWSPGASVSVNVGEQGDSAYLQSFYAQERNTDPANPYDYRWTRDVSVFRLPGVGRNVPLEITLYMAGRPQGAPPADLTIIADGTNVTTVQPSGYPPQPVTVAIPASANCDDDLIITLTSTPFSPPGERRQLGVVVDKIEVRQAGGGFVLPPLYPLAWLILSLLLAYMTMRHLNIGRNATMLAVMMLGAGAAMVLARERYDLTLFVEEVGIVMICAYILALVMPPFAVWVLRKLRVGISASDLRWLMLIYLLAFGVKAGGMMHPKFVDLDHVFRVHQVQELVNNPTGFWDKYQRVTTADETGTIHSEQQHSMLGQWNLVVPFPYSPIGYFVLAPLGWIWPNGHEYELVTASDTMLAALSGTIVFALFALARRGLGSGRAGVIAGAIVSFAPITYLHFSDGAYPYIWAGWISVVYVMAAVCLADRANKPGPFILLSVLSALTILSHTAIAFFAVAFVAAVIAIVWVMRWKRWHIDMGAPLRFMPLLLSFIAGGVLSLVYYGGYIVPVLTISLPALTQRGSSSSGVGLDEQFLGWKLLYGFWPQIAAHFAVWPALMAVAGLLLAGMAAIRRTERVSIDNSTHILRVVTFVFLAAWTVTFLAFSAIDLRVNLLQRHMLFGLPLIALLAGYALAKLDWQAGRSALLKPAPILTALLIAYLFLDGLNLWADRVLRYVLPPGSG
ncbi:MAG: hypothetical protein ABI670_13425 [Chloroflexota bacterium]